MTRALQGSERVRSSTRERVKTIADEMGYVPNMAARTLVKRSSGLIGLVIPDMTNPFFAALARGMENEAAKHDLRIVINDTLGEEAAEREAIRLFLELEVDGLLVPMARCPQDYYEELQTPVPVVHINRPEARHHVSCDRSLGSLAIMQHLIDLGHRRIGFVRGPSQPGVEPKMQAYRQMLDQHGIDYEPDWIFRFDGTVESSAHTADRLLALSPMPTAVFAWNDVSAIGLIHALRERGLRVPDDISVAGHDNIQLSGLVTPPLTTVAWPMYEIGQQSVRSLLSIARGNTPREAAIPAPKLIIRASTGRPGFGCPPTVVKKLGFTVFAPKPTAARRHRERKPAPENGG
ncbi:MAG: LacI family DNA-binding transcriptional regulator, partial [Pseudomonadota bacterium]